MSVKQIVEQLEFQINTKKDRYPEACMKYKEDEDGKRVIEDIKHVTSVELSEIMKKQTGGES